ncbi:MAG: DUF86 domain-containing protein [Desulfobacter sp.]|nr:DUF86 domain-containing protein [Desulfobacter sp.]
MPDEIIAENIRLISESIDLDYEKVDHEIIFDICQNHLPQLQKTIQSMMK